MYKEKAEILKLIDEYCLIKKLNLTTQEKFDLASSTLIEFDKHRPLNYEEFMELLNHNIEVEKFSNINFDDEIVDIEYIGEIEMIDFDIDGNKLFYGNDILIHNSAMNKKDSDNSAISDSIGTAQTADFMCFLLQTDEMKEKSELIFKITKNRYTGRTDFFNMKVDYNKMRVSDVVEFNSKEQQLQTETYVNDEIKRIEIESMQNLTDWTFNDTDKK